MKEIDSLNTFINKYIFLDYKLKERIEQVAVVKQYPTNSSILNEGQFNRHFRFLCVGCVRFHANYDGKDVTTWIETDNQILPTYEGFSIKGRSHESIETLEACSIIEINFNDFESILNDFPIVERFARLWLEREYANQLEFYKFFMFMSAQEKYARLLSYIPNIELRIKAIHIASLLGISPETLSRLRADRLTK